MKQKVFIFAVYLLAAMPSMAQVQYAVSGTLADNGKKIYLIETINTVGNVFFTENVAEFYQMRKYYKTSVCDSIANDITRSQPFSSLKNSLDFEYSFHAIVSSGMLKDMQLKYAQCKQMMEVSDEDIDAYREQREQIDKGMMDDDVSGDSLENRFLQIQETIEKAKAKLKLE